MRSMLRLRSSLLMLLALSTVPLPGCCKRSTPSEPVHPVMQVRTSCVTKELLARRPEPSIPQAIATCLDQGKSYDDCVAHDGAVREAFIVQLLGNCGVKP